MIRTMGFWRMIIPGMLLIGLAACAAPKPPATQKAVGPPILDGRRGMAGFPLSPGPAPGSVGELESSILQAYRLRLELPSATTRPVSVIGDELSWLDTLRVDVSGAKVRIEYLPRQLEVGAVELTRSRVAQLDYLATPLWFEQAQVNLWTSARMADVRIVRDSRNQSGLILAGAEQGFLEISLSGKDLPQAALQILRRGAAHVGANVKSVSIDLRSDDPGSLEGALRVESSILLVPVTFSVHGRMEIDDRFRVHFSNGQARGEDALGTLVASFLEMKMRKTEQEIRPLMRFADDRTQVRWMKFDARDGLRLAIGFGR